MKALLLATMALAALVAPTQAADMPVKAVPPAAAAVYSWTGCYIGVAGGGAFGRSRHVSEDLEAITNHFDVDGGIVGGVVGCNLHVPGSLVVGMEADWSWTNKRGSANDIDPFNTDFTSETMERWLATLRGRIGWANGPWLFYVTGGLAVADVEIHVSAAQI